MKRFLSIVTICALILGFGGSVYASPQFGQDCLMCHQARDNAIPTPAKHPNTSGMTCLTCHQKDGWKMPADYAGGPLVPPADDVVVPDEPADDVVVPEEPADDVVVPDEPADDVVVPDEPADDVVVPEEPADDVVVPEPPADNDDVTPPASPGCGEFDPADRPTIPGCGEFDPTTRPDCPMNKSKNDGTLTTSLSNLPPDAVAVKIAIYPAGTAYTPELIKTKGAEEGFAYCKKDGSPVSVVNADDRKSPAKFSGGKHLAVVKVYDKKLKGSVAATTVVIDGDTDLNLDCKKLNFK